MREWKLNERIKKQDVETMQQLKEEEKKTRENFQSSASGSAAPTKDYTQRRCVPTNGRGCFQRHESYIHTYMPTNPQTPNRQNL